MAHGQKNILNSAIETLRRCRCGWHCCVRCWCVSRNFSRFRFAFDLRRCIGWPQCTLVGKLFPIHGEEEKKLEDFSGYLMWNAYGTSTTVSQNFEAFGFSTDSFVRIFRYGTGRQIPTTPKATWIRKTANIGRMDKIYSANETNTKTHRWQTFFSRAFRCHFSLHSSICAHLKSFKHIFVRLFAKETIHSPCGI